MSLVGMLVTLVCILVLSVVLLQGLNKAVTGEGSVQGGTVRSLEDKVQLYALMQGMTLWANERRSDLLRPSELDGRADRSLDTTANLYSAMIAQRLIQPEQLISGNEYSGYVEPYAAYDYTAYAPAAGRYWDPGFKADLEDLSHVSFAHMPLYGERLTKQWKLTYSGSFPLFGNRGPRNGNEDPTSFTYGRNGVWAGHLVFADGHVDFVQSFTPPGIMLERNGEVLADNIFKIDDDLDGGDALLAFTKQMHPDGPELQWD